MVKINCDGATFRDEKISGVGVVIQDDSGMVLASMSKQLPQLYSALEVEAMAASTALCNSAGFSTGHLGVGLSHVGHDAAK